MNDSWDLSSGYSFWKSDCSPLVANTEVETVDNWLPDCLNGWTLFVSHALYDLRQTLKVILITTVYLVPLHPVKCIIDYLLCIWYWIGITTLTQFYSRLLLYSRICHTDSLHLMTVIGTSNSITKPWNPKAQSHMARWPMMALQEFYH